MTPSLDYSFLSLGSQNGTVSLFDTSKNTLSSSTQVFDCQVNCLRNTGSAEILASSSKKEIFYGQVDSKGGKEGICITTKSDCFSVDIADFIVVAGSEEGEVGKSPYFRNP
jgi:hypothetical protein